MKTKEIENKNVENSNSDHIEAFTIPFVIQESKDEMKCSEEQKLQNNSAHGRKRRSLKDQGKGAGRSIRKKVVVKLQQASNEVTSKPLSDSTNTANARNHNEAPNEMTTQSIEAPYSVPTACLPFSKRALQLPSNFAEPLDTLAIGLTAEEELYLVGSGCVSCVKGSAEMMGHKLLEQDSSSPREFHSPRFQGSLLLKADKTNKIMSSEMVALTSKQVALQVTSVEEAKETLSAAGFEVVVVIKSLKSQPFEAVLTCKGDGTAVQCSNNELSTRLPGLLISLVMPIARGVWPVVIQPNWKAVVDTLVNTTPVRGDTIILISGSKGVGKSTFCRYMVNRLLNQFQNVALLDLDVGQPECTPPGVLSLSLLADPILSPPSHHMQTPLKSYFFGSSTSKSDPMFFTDCARALFQFYKDQYAFDSSIIQEPVPPLVVNTDGWTRGLGLELLGAVVDTICPQHMIKLLDSEKPSSMFKLEVPPGITVHEVEKGYSFSGATSSAKATSATLREHRLINYFLSGFDNLNKIDRTERLGVCSGHISDPGSSLARAFSKQVPYVVPWSEVRLHFIGFDITPSEAPFALNGSLVGLVVCPPDQFNSLASQGISRISSKNLLCDCLGLGFVTVVNPIRKEYALLTPVESERLQQCNGLVQGSLCLPVCIYQNHTDCKTPYITAEAISGALALKSRKNLKRTGQN